MPEQLEMDLYIPRPFDFIDCEDYCTNNECMTCVLCDRYKGEYKAEILASVNKWLEDIGQVF